MSKKTTQPAERHPGWQYVNGQKPAAIAKEHGLTIDDVLDWAGKLGVPDRLLRWDGLGSGGLSREDAQQAKYAMGEAA